MNIEIEFDVKYRNFDKYRNSVEFHASAHDVISSKKGCCSSISSLVNMIMPKNILSGSLLILMRNRQGHVVNYIQYNDSFYFYDMQTALVDQVGDIQSDLVNHYHASKYPSAYVHHCSDEKKYYEYMYRINRRITSSITFVRLIREYVVPPTILDVERNVLYINKDKIINIHSEGCDSPRIMELDIVNGDLYA